MEVISIILDIIWWNFNKNSIDIDDEYLAFFKHIGGWLVWDSVACKLLQCVLLVLMDRNKRKCAYFMVNNEPIIRKNVNEDDYLASDYE